MSHETANRPINIGDLVYHSADRKSKHKPFYIVTERLDWYQNYVNVLCCRTNTKKTYNANDLIKINA